MALRVLIDNLGMENKAQERRSHGGSRPGKRAKIEQEHEVGHEKIMKDYFGKNPLYHETASYLSALLLNAMVLIFENHA